MAIALEFIVFFALFFCRGSLVITMLLFPTAVGIAFYLFLELQ